MVIQEGREAVLRQHGVPAEFLQALAEPSQFSGLAFVAQQPAMAYVYLAERAPAHAIFHGYDIVPVYEGGNGDTFWLLLTNATEAKFVYVTLEATEIYKDYGDNFKRLFVDFLIDYYEFADELPIATLIEYGTKMGFPKAEALFQALAQATAEGLRRTSELDEAWRQRYVDEFL